MVRLSAPLAAACGDETAVVDDRTSLTWRQYDARVNRCLHALRARGHGAGATVALLCGNRHEFLEVGSALFHGGYLFPPIDWHLSPAEIAHVLVDSGATCLVTDDEHVARARVAIERTGRTIDLVVTGDAPAGTVPYERLLAEADPAEPEHQCLGSVMMYTSGTTGRPKGVRSTGVPIGGPVELGHLAVQGYVELFRIDVTGRSLAIAPLYHGGPYLFGVVPFAAGCPIVLRRRFDAERTLRDIDELAITNAYFVPTHFVRLLRLPPEVRERFDGSSLRTVWHTAAPCPPAVKRAMIEWWGPVLHETYAATDAGIGTLIDSHEWLRRPGSVGRASPLSEILVLDDERRPLPAGEVGTVYIRNRHGGDVSYHNDPEKTAAAHLAPGVVTVGDVGHLDEEGYLFLSDRRIDMIVTGGVNVYPAEVEARLLAHPAVVDAAVFGVPDDDLGEAVHAAVQLGARDDAGDGADDGLLDELAEFCRLELAGYKVPRSFEVHARLPRSETGKLVKHVLRDPWWAGRERRI
jgi:long-chain acyl-CoA synthetase